MLPNCLFKVLYMSIYNTKGKSYYIPYSVSATMASEANQIHFVLFPFMAQGHMIPMMDIAKLLAQRGVIITIFTTHKNAARFKTFLDRAVESGLQIQLVQLQFPSAQAGLPLGCENLDLLPELGMASSFFSGTTLLLEPAEEVCKELKPPPSCIISDICLPWTIHIANKFHILRISFSGFCSFYLLCLDKIYNSNVLDSVESNTEYFVVPRLPDHIEFTKQQVTMTIPILKDFTAQVRAAETASYGVIVNSFQELEPKYAEEYKKEKGGKSWCIGPVSLCNKGELDKAQRGNKAAIDEHHCLNWLDSWKQGSVVYACMGSLCNIVASQMVQLALALEASGKPFIWAIRGGKKREEFEKWVVQDGFEKRVKERGLLIRGWAPQVLILSHPAIGGFLTHCGWNSTLEAICAGLPLITWPLFGDQFGNQKLVEQVLKIGVSVGVEAPMKWGEEEEIGVLVKMGDIKKAIERVMDEGQEGEERRRRARELGELATRAVEEGGSSYQNLSLLIEDIMQQVGKQRINEDSKGINCII